MEVLFEKANLDDVERLLEIQKDAFQEALILYEDYETSPAFESVEKITYKIQHHNYYKIIADREIVGGIHIYKKGEGHYYLNRIFVHPNYENMGIGRMAMTFVENDKEFEDAFIWSLETPHKSYKNHYFYESLGYVRTGHEQEINEKLKIIHYKKEIKKV